MVEKTDDAPKNADDMLKDMYALIKEQGERGIEVKDKLETLDVRIAEIEDKRKNGIMTRNGGNAVTGCDPNKFSVARMLRSQATGNWGGAEYERECIEIAERALSTDNNTAGGYLVPAEVNGELIELLRDKTLAKSIGVKFIDNVIGSPFPIQKQTGTAGAAFIGENQALDENEPSFGTIDTTPHQAGMITPMSMRLVRVSNPGIEQLVREDLTLALANLEDITILRGSGVGETPLGINGYPDILVVTNGANGGPVSYDKFAEITNQLEQNNTDMGKRSFVFNPKIKLKLMQLKDSDARPLFTWDPAKDQPSSMLIGFPWATTNALPSNLQKGASAANLAEVFFADWTKIIVPTWGNLQLAATVEGAGAFEKNQMKVRIIHEMDVALRHEESVVYSNDFETV